MTANFYVEPPRFDRRLYRFYVTRRHRRFNKHRRDTGLRNEISQRLYICGAGFCGCADALKSAHLEAVCLAKVVERVMSRNQHALIIASNAMLASLRIRGVHLA